MPKYRVLSREELSGLEEDFIKFLIINGISAEEWVGIKEKDAEKTSGIIASFSDVVFEQILRKVKYLEFNDEQGYKVFKCDEDEIHLIGIEPENMSAIDLSDKTKIFDILRTRPDLLVMYQSSKKYKPDRESEIFRMIQAGAEISDGVLFENLLKTRDK